MVVIVIIIVLLFIYLFFFFGGGRNLLGCCGVHLCWWRALLTSMSVCPLLGLFCESISVILQLLCLIKKSQTRTLQEHIQIIISTSGSLVWKELPIWCIRFDYLFIFLEFCRTREWSTQHTAARQTQQDNTISLLFGRALTANKTKPYNICHEGVLWVWLSKKKLNRLQDCGDVQCWLPCPLWQFSNLNQTVHHC